MSETKIPHPSNLLPSRRINAFGTALTCLSLLVGLFLVPIPATAGETANGLVTVSDDLFRALEEWSSPTATLESVALDGFAEAIKLYAYTVDEVYDKGLADHVAEKFPGAYAEYLEAGESQEDLTSLVAFLMSDQTSTYNVWQTEEALIGQALTFAKWASSKFEILYDVLAEENQTPASQNIALLDFVIDKYPDPNSPLHGEAEALLGQIDAFPWAPDFDCVCWVALAFTRDPFGWQDQSPAPEHTSQTWAGIKQRDIDYEARANGAISDVDFYRLSRHNRHEVRRTRATGRSSMRVRLHCTQQGEPGGQECQGAYCNAELATRIEYGSRVFQRTDAGSWFPRAESLSSDYAELNHTTTGSPAETLFEKGVSVAGSTRTDFDPQALIQLLSGVASLIPVDQAEFGTTLANALSGDLVSDVIEGIFGLVVQEGEPSSHDQNMAVAFDSVAQPITLHANETHNFDLETTSEVYGFGRGGRSESWAEVESSNAFVAVVRNYQCSLAAEPPPGTYWYYATSGAPQNCATLRTMVGDYIEVELGGARPSDADLDSSSDTCP